MFWFSLQLLSATFLMLRRTEWDMIKMYIDIHIHCPVFLSYFNETWIFSTDFRNIFKYQISWKSVRWEPNCSMWADRRKDLMKLIVAFRNFAKVPNKTGVPCCYLWFFIESWGTLKPAVVTQNDRNPSAFHPGLAVLWFELRLIC